jgi:hypothetical protein
LELTDRTFAAFEQPPLYSPNGVRVDGFHVSLAWSLTKPSADVTEKLKDLLPPLKSTGDTKICLEGTETSLKMDVCGIKVKIGNAVHVVGLGSKQLAVAELGENRKRKSVGGS